MALDGIVSSKTRRREARHTYVRSETLTRLGGALHVERGLVNRCWHWPRAHAHLLADTVQLRFLGRLPLGRLPLPLQPMHQCRSAEQQPIGKDLFAQPHCDC